MKKVKGESHVGVPAARRHLSGEEDHLQACVPGSQMVRSSAELVWNGLLEGLWSQVRCFLRSGWLWTWRGAEPEWAHFPEAEQEKKLCEALRMPPTLCTAATRVHSRLVIQAVLPSFRFFIRHAFFRLSSENLSMSWNCDCQKSSCYKSMEKA